MKIKYSKADELSYQNHVIMKSYDSVNDVPADLKAQVEANDLLVVVAGDPTTGGEGIFGYDKTNDLWFTLGQVNTNDDFDGGTTAQRPASPKNYQCFFDTTLQQAIIYNGTKWLNFSNVESGVTANKPASPSAGQVFFDTTLNHFEIYSGSAWYIVGGTSVILTGTYSQRPGSPTVGEVFYATDAGWIVYDGTTWRGTLQQGNGAPSGSGHFIGQQWFRVETNQLYIWNGSTWVSTTLS